MKNILVFDTNEGSRTSLGVLLERPGLRVTCTDDPQEAALYIEAGVDLAIIELAWGDLDGIEILLRVKGSTERFQPVIALGDDLGARATLYGFLDNVDGYLTRPLRQAEVLPQVDDLLQAKSNHDRLSEVSGPLLVGLPDRLPGLFNRRFLTDRLQVALDSASSEGHDIALVVVDIDHFKEINHNFGYPCGNKLLTQLTSFLRSRVRSIDTVCRFGGEEFVAVLPGMDGVRATLVADRLREALRVHTFDVRPGRDEPSYQVQVTACFGVAATDNGPLDEAGLLRLADNAVRAAKRAGKNHTVLAGA